ncbi:MAG TPA: sigma-70 family RNA polymerase sigma factor [Polyangia bacterium]|nr:sigma-70 family RNA polymerase sigma factor [Polyangia bacterium]
MSELAAADQRLLRDLAPHVLAAVLRRSRDFAAAEDAVQEALLAAAQQWPRYGRPDDPRAWLIRVASRRWTDEHRAAVARRRREQATLEAEDGAAAPPATERDDTLSLLFMCCHATLSPSSQVALTLRAVGGLTTAEIARAFLVPEATMAQRISRAKATVKASGVPFELPAPAETAERLGAVLHVVYLVFSEGYAASGGTELQRRDLAAEALRLGRMLHRLLPDRAEVAGLLALMLLTDARRRARSGPDGELIPLDEQDRSTWDRSQIDEGIALLGVTLPKGAVGPYQLQAAIAALHDEAPSTAATDWPQILALYAVLGRITDNPMVALNQVIALAMVEGPAAGLSRLDVVAADPRLAGHYRLDAVRGHLIERAGHRAEAAACYARAADGTASLPERNYLLARAMRLNEARD